MQMQEGKSAFDVQGQRAASLEALPLPPQSGTTLQKSTKGRDGGENREKGGKVFLLSLV